MKRRKLSKRRSKKLFRKTATRTHMYNVRGFIPRGGFRM